MSLTCPFCGLLCDDLSVGLDAGGALESLTPACPRAEAGFRQALAGQASAQLAGAPATLGQAVAAAAQELARARRPLIAGLQADVAAVRAALDLAERCRGVVDYADEGLWRNLEPAQEAGWIATSLSETRNRADLIVVVGARLFERYPRFAERVLAGASLFEHERAVVLLGDWDAAAPPAGLNPVETIAMAPERLDDAIGLLRVLCRGGPVPNRAAATGALERLAQRLRSAQYPVVVWDAGELDGPLSAEGLFSLVRELGAGRRAAGLPLAGADAIGALQVAAWRTGFAPRTAFRPEPEYDPWRHASARLLADAAVDALLWLAVFDPAATPPDTDRPTVVLGHPAMRFERPPAVFIPVGVPGVDHAGELFRSDGLALPLRAARRGNAPPAAEVLARILARLTEAAA